MTVPPEVRRRRSIRLQDYDYSQAGAYFVTLVTHERRCLFGEVLNGEFQPNAYGQIVLNQWDRSLQIRKEMELDGFVVMPNHVHGIVVIADGAGRATGRSPLQVGPAKRSISTFVGGFKAAVTQHINGARGTPGASVWQRNYFEHVIRNEDSLKRIRQYISDNPARWEFDRENPTVQHPEANYAWRIDG